MKITITILLLMLSVLVVSADTFDTGIIGTITVLAPEVTPAPTYTSPSGSSGGSSGGIGVSSDEPYLNIDYFCRSEKDLLPTATYNFDCTFYEINVKGTERIYDVMIRIENLIRRSNNTPTQPEGEVYKFVNAFIGTKRLESAELKFKVPISWASGKDIQLLIWKNKIWNVLPTTKLNEDSEYVYYSTVTDHFSNFAIVGTSKVVSTPEVVQTEIVQPIPTKISITPEVTQKSPGFSVMMIIVAVFGIIYMIRRKN